MIRQRILTSTCIALLAFAAGCGVQGNDEDQQPAVPSDSSDPSDQTGSGDNNQPGDQNPDPNPEPGPGDQNPDPEPEPEPEPGDQNPDPEPEPEPEPEPGEQNPDPEPEPKPGEQPVQPAVDVFGVTRMYPTRAGGEEWFLQENAQNDSRFNPQDTITRNSDGSWKVRDTQVRMTVYTTSGYKPSAITTYNRDQLAAKGYMQSPNDWRDVEITGFVKVNATNASDDNFAWYARGGRHNDSNSGCEGSAYKGDLYYDGRASFAKESWHVSYDYTSKPRVTQSIRGRWVGFKVVMYNITVGGKPAVKMESYLNDNADKVTWTKIFEHVDSGNFGGGARHCGASNDMMPITWGGPNAVFRWDSATDVDFKWLSVREIQP